ncbi:hypothetical protein MCEGE10_00667 [Flavobacteriaceae bacterium]
MTNKILILLSLFLFAQSFGQRMVIKNVNIIPINENIVLKNKSVLIENGKIIKIDDFNPLGVIKFFDF